MQILGFTYDHEFWKDIHGVSPVNSLHKGPVTQKMIPFDDVIMVWAEIVTTEIIGTNNSVHYIWWSASILGTNEPVEQYNFAKMKIKSAQRT